MWSGQGDSCVDTEIFQDVPDQLRSVLARHMTQDVMARARAFSELSEDERLCLAPLLSPVTVGPGVDICMEGEPADCTWILQEGGCRAGQSPTAGRRSPLEDGAM